MECSVHPTRSARISCKAEVVPVLQFRLSEAIEVNATKLWGFGPEECGMAPLCGSRCRVATQLRRMAGRRQDICENI